MAPVWFFNYGMLFELAFAIITLMVGLFAFKIYKLSGQNSAKLFGTAFILISFHYFIQSLLNLLMRSTLSRSICNLMKADILNSLNVIGTYSHMFFFIIGLATLTYMTLKIKNVAIYITLLLTPLALIIITANKLFLFYIISSIFLIIILIHYLKNYIKNKQLGSLLILIAFTFLLLGNFHFIASINHGLYYIIAHSLELIAYILILLNFIMVLKNDKKKK
jgi:hypothetical protein